MDKCIKIEVPVSTDARWYQELRGAFEGIKVDWKAYGFNLIAAYMKLEPKGVSLSDVADGVLSGMKAPTVCFNALDVFTTTSGFEYIINLTSTCPFDELMGVVQPLRDALEDAGFRLTSKFKLHVTLGRVKAKDAKLETLKELLAKVDMPALNLTLRDASLNQMGTCKLLTSWVLE